NGAPWPVCFSRTFHLYTLARYAHGERPGRDRNSEADAPAMASDDEVLEAEPSPGPVLLVGTDGVARGIHRHVALQTTASQRAQLHLAALYVFRRRIRRDAPANG